MKHLAIGLTLLFAVGLIGCTMPGDPVETGETQITVEENMDALSSADIDYLVITISSNTPPEDGLPITLVTYGIDPVTISGIPIGDDREVEVRAYDIVNVADCDDGADSCSIANDILLYAGSNTVDITGEGTDAVTVTIDQLLENEDFVNTAPEFTEITVSDGKVLPGDPVSILAAASDVEDPPEDLFFEWFADGGTFDVDSSFGSPSVVEWMYDVAGTYLVTVRVTDTLGQSSEVGFYITVTDQGEVEVTVDVNSAPVILNMTSEEGYLPVGASTDMSLDVEDPDGVGGMTYVWSTGLNCEGTFDDNTLQEPVFTLTDRLGADTCTIGVEVRKPASDGGYLSTYGFITIHTTDPGAIITYDGDEPDYPTP